MSLLTGREKLRERLGAKLLAGKVQSSVPLDWRFTGRVMQFICHEHIDRIGT